MCQSKFIQIKYWNFENTQKYNNLTFKMVVVTKSEDLSTKIPVWI